MEAVDSDPYAGLYYPDLARAIDELRWIREEFGLETADRHPRPKLTAIQGGKSDGQSD